MTASIGFDNELSLCSYDGAVGVVWFVLNGRLRQKVAVGAWRDRPSSKQSGGRVPPSWRRELWRICWRRLLPSYTIGEGGNALTRALISNPPDMHSCISWRYPGRLAPLRPAANVSCEVSSELSYIGISRFESFQIMSGSYVCWSC